MEDYKDDLCFAGSGQDILRARQSGRLACLLAIEGGEALEGKLAHLRNAYRLGVRLLTLTWNFRNDLASGQMEGAEGGLSRFGREAVEEMNRLRMLVDVSHLNEPGFWDVIEVSTSPPIIASHSNAKGLCDHPPRNLSDEQIRSIADGGGVIGVNFFLPFSFLPGAKPPPPMLFGISTI